jgi:hypothetical protein
VKKIQQQQQQQQQKQKPTTALLLLPALRARQANFTPMGKKNFPTYRRKDLVAR